MKRFSAQNTLLLPVIASGVAILALLYFLAIGPKRSDSAKAATAVTSHEQRLKAAQQQVADYAASQKRFPGMLVELRRLDIAVPARADISGLLREVQRRARLRDSALRVVTLKAGTPAAAEGAASAPVIPGATPGTGGMSTLPFTFAYTGRYFDLLKVLRAVRQAVTVKSGNLSIDGRLLTIDGVAFQRPDPTSKLTKVTLNATAYIATAPAAPPADGAAAPAADGTAAPAADGAAAPAPTKAGS